MTDTSIQSLSDDFEIVNIKSSEEGIPKKNHTLVFQLLDESLKVPIYELDMIQVQEEECHLTYYFPSKKEESKDDSIPFIILGIDHNSVRCFVELLNEKACNIEPNFDDITKLCNYFCVSKKITEYVYEFSGDDFTSPVSILTAYTLNNRIIDISNKDISGIMDLESFPLVRRLQFMIAHGKGNDWSSHTQSSSISEVSTILNIPCELLTILHTKKCVIAGGAAMYLGCPWTKWKLRCDIDFFVFDTDESLKIIHDLVLLLKNYRYTLCLSSPSVITAIGTYGMRKIQIIRSAAKDVDGLTDNIAGFDFNAVKTYYDGKELRKTLSAEYDWVTKKCSGGCYRDIVPIRLFGMYWKGFSLNTESIEYLKNTIGWPVPQKVIDDFENDIVCLNPCLPDNVQHSQLEKLHLPVITDLSNTIKNLEVKFNTYGPTGLFINLYDEYVATMNVGKEETFDGYRGSFYKISSVYSIRIPLCNTLWNCVFQDIDKHRILRKLTMIDEKEYSLFRDMENKILKLAPIQVSSLNIYGKRDNYTGEMIKPYNDIKVKCDKDTQLYINGIKVSNNTVISCLSKISAIGHPKSIYDKLSSKARQRLNEKYRNDPNIYHSFIYWKLTKVFVIQHT